MKSGDVVAIIGDYDPKTILTLLKLVEKKVILVPLTNDTKSMHKYFFESALVDFVIEGDQIIRINQKERHELIDKLKDKKHGGLVSFSTGTTGRPKAILHDLTLFMKRYYTPRPKLRTINFLLFDHIGGLNTLFHTLFNGGTIIAPKSRSVESILSTCAEYKVELLPTTPTFLRIMIMSGLIPENVPSSLKCITYGTELMDQTTLDTLCELLPKIDFSKHLECQNLVLFELRANQEIVCFLR